MAVVVLSHPVVNYQNWKAVYDADAERRTGAGLKEIVVGQDSNDPNMAYMVFQTEQPGAIHQMLSDPNLAEVMKEAGVTDKPKVTIIQ